MKIIFFKKQFMQHIQKEAAKHVNKKVLDIGCGRGEPTFFFGKRNKTIGIDLQDAVLEKYRNFDFQVANALDLPFKKNSFDLVVSFEVIEHLENDKKMLSEAYRVLKKGDKIFLGTPNKTRLSHLLLKLIGKPIKYPLVLGEAARLGQMVHIREYTAEELKKLMKSVGFKNIKVTPLWFGLMHLKYGLSHVPRFLEKYCQFLFVEAIK